MGRGDTPPLIFFRFLGIQHICNKMSIRSYIRGRRQQVDGRAPIGQLMSRPSAAIGQHIFPKTFDADSKRDLYFIHRRQRGP